MIVGQWEIRLLDSSRSKVQPMCFFATGKQQNPSAGSGRGAEIDAALGWAWQHAVEINYLGGQATAVEKNAFELPLGFKVGHGHTGSYGVANIQQRTEGD
ncbi:hypothetical protein CC1G_14906 [Coprinopsis cinerea okayama7|uniref:Uncharacterized protein n=1 Tax=Coprinopsis cinerea (strain Okayama-7 / 130 / ATCC MYA-4618 / FGSC 9003) TaxID=240176 RepID=D6RNR9_COPC7|nr:hypothetical protein CC1G_14906 [Coprinopsis cinerea okayama7\|eukprot:XP_002910929.1 hypothetical protein CC1G_14906 [Coprinopsis cinerea okayama7\